MRTKSKRTAERGAALLAVLWLTAALAIIAFSVATTVRGETDRVSTANDSVRAYYLATGAVDRAALWILWGQSVVGQDGVSPYYNRGVPSLTYTFSTGVATVEIIPESAKLNINNARPEQLYLLLQQLGQDPQRAQAIANAIVDWRTPAPGGVTPFDQLYAAAIPSFRARHASLEEIEELLLVRGITPELFYGSFVHTEQGRLTSRPGLRDCVSVFGTTDRFDANSAEAPLLATVGLSADAINALIRVRRAAPIRTPLQLQALAQSLGPGALHLGIGGGTIYTLRSTARLRRQDGSFSDLRRSVAATIKFTGLAADPAYQTLRWYDNVWRNQPAQ
jgi:general secretion pathway protein K